jgi:hypothetical protein
MSAESRWLQELEAPSSAFFKVFAARVAEPEGVRDAVREAVKTLVPRIDWEAYLPHVPHGILGLRAVLRMRGLLGEASFRRALAIQVHMAAHEGRREPAALAQVLAAKGSGSWRNLESFVASHRPALAYAEAQGFELPVAADFQRLGQLTELDMANVGHKAILADHLGELQERLELPKAVEDTFWARRAAKRLADLKLVVIWGELTLNAEALETQAREVCDLGLVALLDNLTARLKAGQGAADTLAALVLAASEKQLDARRDLEGKTAWTFAYLATLARTRPTDPRVWCQAAALVNLFPTDEEEGRLRPAAVAEPTAEGLTDAVLDLELVLAMSHALGLVRAGQGEAALAALAEAATRNDPTFNHAHQLLAVAAAADLLPHLPAAVAEAMVTALAKSLANSQGSGDLGRAADRALGH